jgi:hypothetical protein
MHQLKPSNEYKKELANGWFLAVTHVFLFLTSAKHCVSPLE